MSQKQLMVIGVVAAIAVVVVLFLTHALGFAPSSVNSSNISSLNSSNISSLFSAMQNKYNSSGPFNFSYAIYLNLSSSSGSTGLLNTSDINGTVNIARFGNSVRSSATMNNSYPYRIFNASIKVVVHDISIYNGKDFTACSKEFIINESPVNGSIASAISVENSRPFTCNSSAEYTASFNIVNTFTMVPFSAFNPSRSNFSSFKSGFKGAAITFLGGASYSGQKCSMEELTPPAGTTGDKGVSIKECISSTNGISIYSLIGVNGTTVMRSVLSSVNPAPVNAVAITAIP